MKKVGNYMLLSEIGKGQFGVVYKAQHTKTEEIFAIKSITKSSLNSSAKLKELFDTEVKIMSNIKHPNIMHLYELLETTNNYYLVLDYCRSGDMEGYVKKHKGLGEDEAVYFIMQIMNGFRELHKHKIMHRDFKLANIFLNDDTVVIGDFGFAKSGNEMAATKLGSPITMAPEILLNKSAKLSYTNKADLWSIGVCFFEMIFGAEPWPNVKSVDDLCLKVQAYSGKNLVFPASTRFKIGADCQELLINLIEIDPNRRISWNDFYNHKVFAFHQAKKAGNDTTKSIMFRNNQDTVVSLFNQNRMRTEGEYELNMNPETITGFQQAALGTYEGIAKAERIKNRILDRYTHEKRVMTFFIQTSVKLRNLSKERQQLQKAASGLMICGVLLLKKASLMNSIALDSLKKNINAYGLEGYESFFTTPERARLIDELELTDVPTYHKLLTHLLNKMRTEMDPSEPRTREIIKLAEDPNLKIFDYIESELRKETFYLIEFFSVSYGALNTQVKMDLQQALTHLYISSRHQTELPFLQDNIVFDWYLFEKSWEGAAGVEKMNKLLNKAFNEKF